MKAAIIVFSPSSNTIRIDKILEASLMKNSISVQMVNITGNDK